MNVLSLFDGMSCGRIALERAGVKVDTYYASEIDKYAMQVSKANWPDIIQIGNVTKVHAFMLKEIDLLIGGSPCQGFSFAGKQLNFNDPRSKLFFEFVRLLEEIREYNPDVLFFLENVNMKKEYQDVISKCLGVQPIVLNSNLVSAQNRKRLYWTNIPYLGSPKDKKIYLRHVIDGPQTGELTLNKQEIDAEIRNFTKRHTGFTHQPNGNIRPYRKGKITMGELGSILHTDNKSNTIIKSHAPKVYIGNPFKIRKITQREAERLQTLPEGYTKTISYRQAISAIGNGWTVDVIKHFFLPLGDYSFMF